MHVHVQILLHTEMPVRSIPQCHDLKEATAEGPLDLLQLHAGERAETFQLWSIADVLGAPLACPAVVGLCAGNTMMLLEHASVCWLPLQPQARGCWTHEIFQFWNISKLLAAWASIACFNWYLYWLYTGA